jgi:hypothetical protein
MHVYVPLFLSEMFLTMLICSVYVCMYVCTDLLLVPFVLQNLIAIVMEQQFHFGNIML